MMKQNWFFHAVFGAMILGSVTNSVVVYAQDDSSAMSTPETAEAGEAKIAVQPTATPAKRLTKKASEYKVSKYTSERSEKEADQMNVWLGIGLDKIYDLDSEIQLGDRTGSVLESNTNVVKVVPVTIGNKKQFIFKGLAEGNANVTIRDKAGNVRIIYNIFVAKQDLVRMMEDLKRNLKEIEGLDIHLESNKIVISGEVLTVDQYGAYVNVISDKIYADSVSNRVVMSPITLNALAKKIEQDIQVFAQTVRASVLNGKIVLEGTVESDGLRQRALRRAEWYLPTAKLSDPVNKDSANIEKNDKPLQIIQSDIQVNAPQPKRESKLVRLSVYFVELSKDFLKAFGFKWQPGFTADPSISIGTATDGSAGSSNSGGFTFAGTLSSLFPALNSTPASASYARILKSATSVVKSGEKSKVSDYVDYPTISLGQNGTTGTGPSQSVGFAVEITPTILQGQDVDVNIDLDQKNLLGKGLNGALIVGNHHLTSRLYLKSGETAALAGVNNSDLNTTFNRDDPNAGTFSGSTKPLFTLQRSKSTAKKRSQFVVFVSPQIIETASEGTEDLKKNFRMPAGAH